MARNKVQFQKGLSEGRFDALYGTEQRCRDAVFGWRWPGGFVCPVCGGREHSLLKTRALYQCTACRRQTSLTAGTIFAASKLPLRTWFRAIYHLTQSKGGISSLELGRRLGVTQTTAWKVKHKLMQVMMERDAGKRLSGRIEIDDAYLGGERHGGKRGRGSAGKTPFVAAVETTAEGKPIRLKLRRVRGFRRTDIVTMAKPTSSPPATSSVTACAVSTVSWMPVAHISRSSPGAVAGPLLPAPSNGSTPSLATSRTRSPAPTVRSAQSTCRATLPNSSTASTGAMISPP
jgi:ribosomal protein L37AE/L43A